MKKKVVAGIAVVASAAFGAFAASGFGETGGSDSSAEAFSVQTHAVKAPPPEAAVGAPAAKASLFRVISKSSRPKEVPAGYSSAKVGSCPKGSSVLSAWFERSADDPTGLLAAGGAPDGGRKWTLIVNNTTGESRNAKFGIICIKG